MFNGIPQGVPQIAQGAVLHIFNRKDFTATTANVTSVSQPHVSKAAQANPALMMQGFVVDVFMNMGDESTSIEFPVNSQSANYPDKGWFISADPQAVAREIENAVSNSKQFLAQVPYHEKVVKDGPALILSVSPDKRLEVQQAEKITSLEAKISEMSARMEQMVGLLSAGVPANTKKKE